MTRALIVHGTLKFVSIAFWVILFHVETVKLRIRANRSRGGSVYRRGIGNAGAKPGVDGWDKAVAVSARCLSRKCKGTQWTRVGVRVFVRGRVRERACACACVRVCAYQREGGKGERERHTDRQSHCRF